MQLHDLAPASGSKKSRKRVGRGPGSGHGKTATRGYNGQKSRAGGAKANGFEGGQTPLARRLPKLPGFRNINRVEYAPVNVGRLEMLFDEGDIVDATSLCDKGIIKNTNTLVKILGDGTLSKSLIIRVEKVSSTAAEKITSAGGKVETPC